MTQPLTKSEARAFRARWRRVNVREEKELRSDSLETKLKQFNTLLAWAQQFGWNEALDKDVTAVRKRWARLRKAYDLENHLKKRKRRRGKK